MEPFKKMAQAIDEGQGLAETITAVKDENGRDALYFSAQDGRIEICKYLLEDLSLSVDTWDDNDETPLIHVARQGHFQTTKYLLDHGTDSTTTSNELEAMAWYHAAGIGCVELITLFLSKGVLVDAPSDVGPPLIWVAGHDKSKAVKTIFDGGANPNGEIDDGVTALLVVVAAGSLESLELLVKKGDRMRSILSRRQMANH
eukprot:Gb_11327 [translate_table: standard]